MKVSKNIAFIFIAYVLVVSAFVIGIKKLQVSFDRKENIKIMNEAAVEVAAEEPKTENTEMTKYVEEYNKAVLLVKNSNSKFAIARTVMSCSRKYDIPVYVIYSVIFTESGGSPYEGTVNKKITSNKHCRGLMQISENALAEYNRAFDFDYDFDEMFNVIPNINVGCWYFAERFKGYYDDWSEAYCLYNAGFGNFSNGKRSPTPESKAMCRTKVKAAVDRYERIESIVKELLGA